MTTHEAGSELDFTDTLDLVTGHPMRAAASWGSSDPESHVIAIGWPVSKSSVT